MDGRAPLPHLRRKRRTTALVALAAVLALGTPARALGDDGDPSLRWPTDGPAVQAAVAVAQDLWGMVPCQGAVTIWWEDLDATIDAQAVWDNPIGQYAAPSRNIDCEISLNARGQWDWPKLCTILVHEVGHLAGHDHVADLGDVMYFSFRQPLRQCLALPEPAAAPAAPEPPEAPAAAPPAQRGATRQPKARQTPARSRPAAKQQAKTARRGAAKRRSTRPPARGHRTARRR